jgi:hypothetical protein
LVDARLEAPQGSAGAGYGLRVGRRADRGQSRCAGRAVQLAWLTSVARAR